ncbi:zinc-dependent alcohol dehydrogenase [Nocardioides immobilis]|uniref:zinc-dependent alcohol dehydrogenase n=1 Tax=Nocardioides immobilis TaxID=2049295 RepID=UPI0015FCC44F|nr:alcohol dehydrogenase catalytic domain-containing protein [Nocardioides immobilis]
MAEAIVKTRTGAGGVEIRDVTTPPPGPGQVRVEVAAAGICGTDLHILDGEWPTTPPVVMGHELSGTVVDCGPGVSTDWLGAGVVAEVLITDGTCGYCLRGQRNMCPNRRAIGRQADGAFTRFVVVPEVNLHRVPEGLDLVEAALAEPLACVLGALMDRPVVAPGDRILITGPGTIGLLAAQVARMAGGQVTVLGTAKDRYRLAVAEQLGFATLGLTAQVEPSDVEERYDVVIECAGAAAAINLGLAACAKSGTLVQLGIFGKSVQTDMDQFCLKNIAFVTSFAAAPRTLERALVLLSSGQIAADPIITNVSALRDWPEVFAHSRGGDGLKYMFDPRL